MISLYLRTRNHSSQPLKNLRFAKRVIYRMGSTTPTNAITSRPVFLEINQPQGCRNSSDKRTTKVLFQEANNAGITIPQAEFFIVNTFDEVLAELRRHFEVDRDWRHGCIAKRYNSSKGNGLFLINTLDDFNAFKEFVHNNEREVSKFVFEKYYTYTKEYRLHVDKWFGCFYANRKMLLEDARVRWHRHDDNSVWVLEENPLFDTPETWDKIKEACVNALNVLGLDMGAFDIKVSRTGAFIIMECNSAPGLGAVALEKYAEELNKIVAKESAN